MELIFIGNHFYLESGTMMSSIYDIEGRRQDWGFVQRALRSGESVHIRPASTTELKPYLEMLAQYKQEKRAEKMCEDCGHQNKNCICYRE